MYLKTQVEVRDIKLSDNPAQPMEKQSVTFSFGEVFIELFDIENNHCDEYRGSFRLTSVTKLVVPAVVQEMMDAYCDGKKPKPNSKARAIAISDLSIHDEPTPPLSMYPAKLDRFLTEQVDIATDRLKSFVSTLRWRFNIDTNINPCSKISSYCSKKENEEWRNINDLVVKVKSRRGNAIPIMSVISSDTLGLYSTEDGEPTGHELLREAKELSSISVRASLIMGIASVEVRLKDLISARSPSSEWLIKSLPSPPVMTIISRYLPELFPEDYLIVDAISKFKKTNHYKTLDIQIQNRNATSHSGAKGPQPYIIDKLLESVEQFLWFCDFLSGFEWAEEYFDNEIMSCFADYIEERDRHK
jgi:hypothetical protein